MSEAIGSVVGVNLASALLKSQREIEGVSKSSDNPYFKSKYADLTAVIESTIPVLNKHGIVVIQSPVPPPFEGHLAITTMLLHESGESISGTAVVPLTKQDPQAYGSAMTYARRYSLASIIGLKTLDDDAESAVRSAPVKQAEAKTFKGFPGNTVTVVKEQAKATPRGKTSLFPKVGSKRTAPQVDGNQQEFTDADIPF